MAGCGTWSPAEPLRIPAALLAACPESRREIETNQDLAEAYLETRAALRECIDAIEVLGIAPAAVSPAYWRTLANRLAARLSLPEYTAERHAAWLTGRAMP